MKWLSIVDEYTRECLALEVGRGITADRVIEVLAKSFTVRGAPRHIRCDNGPEFIATVIRSWLENARVEALYIEPGSPWENGYAESFHSRLRDELLNREEFASLAEVRAQGTAWRLEYNHRRSHSSLGIVPLRSLVLGVTTISGNMAMSSEPLTWCKIPGSCSPYRKRR